MNIIAEIGVNHEGNIEKAKELIKKAKNYNFDAIKLQHIVPSKIWDEEWSEKYKLGEKETLKKEGLKQLAEYANSLGIKAGCTPTFQGSSAEILEAGCDFIKIASPQAEYDRFILDEAIATRLPLIISNGKSDLKSSIKLISYLSNFSNGRRISFLYCISAYPADHINFDHKEIVALQETSEVNGISFGLSDHYQSIYPALQFKFKYNGTVFEKHFCDVDTNSLDKEVSIHSWQAQEYVRQLRLDHHKNAAKSRAETIKDDSALFASAFFLSKDVKKGEIFNLEDCKRLRCIREIDYIKTNELWSGKLTESNNKYTRDLKANSILTKGDLS